MDEQKTNPTSTTKKAKIILRRAIVVDLKVNKLGTTEGRIIEPNAKNEPVEVTEEEARQACDETFLGHYAFGGERYNDQTKNDYRRAIRA